MMMDFLKEVGTTEVARDSLKIEVNKPGVFYGVFNWCVLCRRIKRQSILSLCEPRTLFKGFNQNPIKKTH